MALTFNVARLLELVDTITAAKDAEEERYAAECAKARAKYEAQWWTAHREPVRKLRDYLTKSLKADKPPLHDVARSMFGDTGYRGELQMFAPGGDGNVNRRALGYYRSDELEGLGALLRAHLGDTVTAHQLKELGTHPKDLAKLFRAATEAGAVVAS